MLWKNCPEHFFIFPGQAILDHQKGNAFKFVEKQLLESLPDNFENIIVAYEPIWSIGTGKIPNQKDLFKTITHIKKVLKSIYKKNSPAVLYGGSVDENNIDILREIKEIDGFLIGGASKSSKKFIDIIKNYYR